MESQTCWRGRGPRSTVFHKAENAGGLWSAVPQHNQRSCPKDTKHKELELRGKSIWTPGYGCDEYLSGTEAAGLNERVRGELESEKRVKR